MPKIVDRSELITSKEDAVRYYVDRLVGAHKITCHGLAVTIVFERHACHLFSKEAQEPIPGLLLVLRNLPGGQRERRMFNLERAQLMDQVLPAISLYTLARVGGGRAGQEKTALYGPPLKPVPALVATDARLLVALRPGPAAAFTCVSAYPVPLTTWQQAARTPKPVKFPP